VSSDPYLREVRDAWRRTVPGVTDAEVAALLPLVRAGHRQLNALVLAYRAGRRAATPLPPPLSGFRPCPECLSVRVGSVVLPGPRWRMLARCADCATLYDPGTGEPASSPDAAASELAPAPAAGDGVVGTPDSAGAP
jgi:hypothetical protein